MSFVYPKEIRADEDDEERELAFEWQEELASAGPGAWILFPNGVQGASVELEIGTGEGYVEATVDSIQDVKAGLAAVSGKKWPSGNVTITEQDYLFPVTALRQVNVSGTTLLKVRMQ